MPFVIISIIISIMICLSFFIAILRTCLQSIIIVYSSKMICWGHIWHYILPFIKLKVYSSYYIRFNVELRGGSRNFLCGGLTWKNWKKWPPRTYAEQKIDDFSFVFMHILKKLEKNLEKIGKNPEKKIYVGGPEPSPLLNSSLTMWFVCQWRKFKLIIYHHI